MQKYKKIVLGGVLCPSVALVATCISNILPVDVFGVALISLVLGMLLNPVVSKFQIFKDGINWTSKRILRAGIILAGVSLSFSQVFQAGKYALLLLAFTLTTAFSMGYICRKIFKINWKMSGLLSISTAICGGTAVATLGPVIDAEDKEIAYALSATFIFDLLTVIAFPWMGVLFGLSNTAYGLWVGTAVNDTSSVVAAGYAFSEIAGSLATIVKLTRTLFIVPIVLIFAWIYTRKEMQNKECLTRSESGITETSRDLSVTSSNNTKTGIENKKIRIVKIFPWFILGFLAVVGIRSTGLLSESIVDVISTISKFFLATALGAVGLKTSLKEVAGVGVKPMVAGVMIDISVVIVALFAQAFVLKF